ncbi:Bax inhibitor-1/YccA family protein [Candidatus Omnitrophota bacterium]
MRTGNPALRTEAFAGSRSFDRAETMSVQGVVNKTLLLLCATLLTASWVWKDPMRFVPFTMPVVLIALGLAFVTIFKKEWAAVTAPAYAALEGLLLGCISAIFEKSYPGIVIQAVMLTFGVLFCLLMAYKSRLIKVTDNFRLGIVAATGAIALFYVVNFVLGFFGIRIPLIHEAGPIGIGFSLFVVGIAALNLVLDFDFIERASEKGAPKYMEWYGAFGLMVTLIWLYFEILILLSKIRRR